MIFSEHFHSITDRIFHFKIHLWFSGLLNRTIDSDIKVLNHVLLTLASDHDKQKSKTLHTKIFAKNKPELTVNAISTEVSSQKSDEVLGSKGGMHKFHDVWKSKFLWLIYVIYDSSNNVNYVVWCLHKGRPRYCWQNQICYCKKSLNVKGLFFLIKVWNMTNVSSSSLFSENLQHNQVYFPAHAWYDNNLYIHL